MNKKSSRLWILYLLFFIPAILFPLILVLDVGGRVQDYFYVQAPIVTPIPTLIPATMPAPMMGSPLAAGTAKCSVNAEIFLRTWIAAGYPESERVEFTDVSGVLCQATFEDLQILFNETNLWYPGASSCVTCHNANVTVSSAQLDMSSYAGILSGSRRASVDAEGQDILGGGVAEQSLLYQQLFVTELMPLGRIPGAVPEGGPIVLAGTPKSVP
jgi:hypothetical protein